MIVVYASAEAGDSGAPPDGSVPGATLRVAVEVDRETARLVGFTVSSRPYSSAGELEAEGTRSLPDRMPIEVAVLTADGRRFTRRLAVGPICLDHPGWAEPHVTGDRVVGHRESVVTELPAIPGFDRVEVARSYDGPEGIVRKVLCVDTLDAARAVAIEGPNGGAATDGRETQASLSGNVLWPESFGDTDRYRVYGNAGEADRRTNIVIVPDGYTYAEKATMVSHATSLVNAFRARTPFREHDRFLNYVLVYAYSVESGTDQCDCGIVRDTAMSTYFPNWTPSCGSSDNRCLYYGSTCDFDSSENLALAELRAPGFDYARGDRTLVMVNTSRYGGCGGYRGVYAAANGSATEIAIHELGHSFAELSDEYESDPSCGFYAGEINTSLNPVTGAWPEWIPNLGAPRQGAEYYTQCLYRPQLSCEMRSLGQAFCPVCTQRFSLVFFEKPRVQPTAPVASRSPVSPFATTPGTPVSFAVTTRFAVGAAVTNDIRWELRGPDDPAPVVVATGTTSYTRAFDREGTFVLTCRVTADTNFIRAPTNGPNVDVVSWTVDAAIAPPSEVSPPGSIQALVFTAPVTLAWDEGGRSRSAGFNLYRGDLATLRGGGGYGACVAPSLLAPTVTDTDVPPAGAVFTYLVTGINAVGEGPMGADSQGNARPNASPCAVTGRKDR